MNKGASKEEKYRWHNGATTKEEQEEDDEEEEGTPLHER